MNQVFPPRRFGPPRWRVAERGCMVAPVVGCGSCAAGSAPARAAAVWLSVWGSGDNREAIHTRPDRHRSPSPSALLHQLSPPSFLSNSSDLTPPSCLPDCRLPHFILYIPALSVCPCLASTLPRPSFWFRQHLFASHLKQKPKHQQLQRL